MLDLGIWHPPSLLSGSSVLWAFIYLAWELDICRDCSSLKIKQVCNNESVPFKLTGAVMSNPAQTPCVLSLPRVLHRSASWSPVSPQDPPHSIPLWNHLASSALKLSQSYFMPWLHVSCTTVAHWLIRMYLPVLVFELLKGRAFLISFVAPEPGCSQNVCEMMLRSNEKPEPVVDLRY